MPATAQPPEKTGNPALDSALEAFHATRTKFDTKIAELVEADSTHGNRIAELEKQRDAESKRIQEIAEQLAGADAPVAMTDAEKKKFSRGRVAGALYREMIGESKENAWEDAGFEREYLESVSEQELRQIRVFERAVGTISDEKAGILIPSTPLQDFIDLLRDALVLAKLGVRFLPGLNGHQIPITGFSTGAVAFWLGESDEPTKSEPTFKRRYLNPHRVGGFVPVANPLLRWSPMAVESMINEDLIQTLARKIEEGCLFGGVSGSVQHAPLGLVNDDGVQTLELGADANSGGRFRSRHSTDFELLLELANVDIDESAGFLLHPQVKALLKKEGNQMFSGQTEIEAIPIGTMGINDAAVENRLGYKFASSNAIPNDLTKGTDTSTGFTYTIFGNWRQFMIGQWGGIRLRASKETGNATYGSAFLKDETWICADAWVDGLARRPEAFVVCADTLRTA